MRLPALDALAKRCVMRDGERYCANSKLKNAPLMALAWLKESVTELDELATLPWQRSLNIERNLFAGRKSALLKLAFFMRERNRSAAKIHQ
jgi:hypothetical protein